MSGKTFPVNNWLIAVIAAAFFFVMYQWLKPDSNWTGLKVAAEDTVTLTLPDRSTAVVIGPSQIGYPKKFDEKVRNVKLEGEVIFDIKESAESFLAQTEKGGIETNQAKVSINTASKDSLIVHCYEGAVRMIGRGKKVICEAQLQANQVGRFYIKNTEIIIDSM